MSGYSGITTVMMPNGVTYYYFSDKEEFSWYNAVHETNKQKSVGSAFCSREGVQHASKMRFQRLCRRPTGERRPFHARTTEGVARDHK